MDSEVSISIRKFVNSGEVLTWVATLQENKIQGDKDLSDLQDDVSNQASSLLGKGGPGEEVGKGLSENLL